MDSTIARIDLGNLRHNVLEYQNLLGDTTKIIAVIKADAYGHGAIPVAKTLLDIGIKFFAISRVKEGIELVKAGISGNILILGGTLPEQMKDVVEYGLIPTIYNIDQLRQLENANKDGDKKHSFHLKVETGMHRLGVNVGEDLEEFLDVLDECEHVRLSGVYSHFAVSDSDPLYTKSQYKRFTNAMRQIRAREYRPKTHISNSAAISAYDYCKLDYVRLGIGMYGLRPDSRENVDIKPVMSLITKIVHVSNLDEGETVSYGRTYTADEKRKTAVLPIGYADGYPRILGNKAQVLVGGHRCNVLGRVCMDHAIIDVTSIDNVSVGDEAVLIGEQGNDKITAKELADLCQTIHYEIVTGVQKRVDREYVGVKI